VVDWPIKPMDIKTLHEDLLRAIDLIERGRLADGLKIIRDAEIQVEWEVLHERLTDGPG